MPPFSWGYCWGVVRSWRLPEIPRMRINRKKVKATKIFYCCNMYNFSDMGSNNNVPAFLTKLWTLVEDTSTDDMICWDPVSTDVKLHFMISVV